MATLIDRPTIVDDDLTGSTGTVADAAWVADFCDRIDEMFDGTAPFYLGGALGLGRYTTTATGTQNDWDIDAANGDVSVGILRCNNASALTINGIVAPTGHRLLLVLPVNSSVVLAHEAGGSTAANRITTQGAANVTVLAGGLALLLYDVTSARWRLISVSSGAPGTSTITTTGTQTALSLPIGSADLIIFANNGSTLTLQGITAGADGQRLTIISIGAGQVDVANQNGSASAANRIINMITATVSLKAGSGRIEMVYDATATRWRVVAHDQGGWIDYSGTSTVTGWSSFTSGRKLIYYKVINSQIHVSFLLEGTSNATTVTFTLPFTAADLEGTGLLEYGSTGASVQDNGSSKTTACRIRLDGNTSTVSMYADMATGVWTNSGTKSVRGSFWFPGA